MPFLCRQPKKVRVLAFTRYGRLGASSRVRVLQYIPYLQENGFEVKVQALFADDYLSALYRSGNRSVAGVLYSYVVRMLALWRILFYDVIWVEKELFPGLPAIAEQLLRWMGKVVIVDYDDAIFHNYDLSNSVWTGKILNKKIDRVMACASLVTTGNEYLAQRARSAGAHNVMLLPTVVDFEKYKDAVDYSNDVPTVGWIGSPYTAKYLLAISDALVQVHREIPFKLIVIGGDFCDYRLMVECKEWSEIDEVKQISSFDVGIMPLPDSPWERGKCGYKLIQYMACGKPVVGSPVGVNTEIVDDAVGYLAATPNDWVKVLVALLNDRGERMQKGKRARIRVQEKYSMQVWAPKLVQQFRNFAQLK